MSLGMINFHACLCALLLLLDASLATDEVGASCDPDDDEHSSSGTTSGFVPTAFRDPEDDEYRSLVDLARYPIDDLDGAVCQRIIAEATKQWDAVGAVSFPGFVREDIRAQLAAEVAPASGMLSHQRIYTAPYLAHKLIQNVSLDDSSHPLRRLFQTDIHAVAADQVPRLTLLRTLYDSPQVAAFFARVVGKRELWQYDDEFQKINVMWMKDAGQRSWHYDGSDFVATLLVQEANAGGEFEFAPFIRGEAGFGDGGGVDERFGDVRDLFDGAYAGPRLVGRAAAGSMQLFNGKRSLHRVRAVYGPATRITAVLSYDTHPRCGQSTPSVEANVRNYGDRVRRSGLWARSQESRRLACAGMAPPLFETEG